MRSLCSVNHKASISESVSAVFFYFYWLSFYRSVKFRYRKIRVTCCVRGRHKKSVENGRICRHTFSPYLSVNEEGFFRKTSASFRILKIYKQVTPSQRDMSTQKAASQCTNRTPIVHSMQTGASRESDSVSVTF